MITPSIKLKITLFASGSLLIALVIASVIELHYLEQEMKNVLADQQSTLVSSVADDLDQKLASNLRALTAAAQSFTADIVGDRSLVKKTLGNRPALRTLFNDLFIISTTGEVIADLPVLGRTGINIADQDNFRSVMATGKPYVSRPFIGKAFHKPLVTMSAPVFDANGKTIAILNGSLNLLESNILGNMSQTKVGKTGGFAVLTRDRVIVMSTDKDRIMTNGPPPGVSPYFDRATAGEAGAEEATNSRGLQAIFSYKPLQTVPWVLVAALPIKEAYAPMDAAHAQIKKITAILALVVAPLAWLGASLLLRPLTQLRDAIRELRKTPTERAVVAVGRRDEIGDLAHEFNEMMAERRAARDARDHAAEEVAQKNVELINANEVKTRFLATMSHELRTPLNAIIGFTGTVLMRLPGPLNAEQEKQLRTVQRSAKHLLSLINTLLDVAKIDAGKSALEIVDVDCSELLDEIAFSLRPQAERKGLDLCIVAPDERLSLPTDRTKLGQILLNLVQNAIKFTEDGRVTITLSDMEHPAGVIFEVRDSGIGISAAEHEKLFGAFYRAGNAGTKAVEGTGLGLYVSQNLAHLLGGSITVESQMGVGTTFRLVLPLVAKSG